MTGFTLLKMLVLGAQIYPDSLAFRKFLTYQEMPHFIKKSGFRHQRKSNYFYQNQSGKTIVVYFI
jgi:hypothetical protein